ncbi:MAG: hypothetical protein HYX28_09190 [Candidatus Koribacter versatilis]|uniref:Carboxypeptidase regulatory-like domain-containing protein n=1 Tax=Candidatus Korobacter versatilis TaxID=658062 RepID=A0A932EQ68_9BACT|nr:hypothetical protein [Candidatus Koribacter versatilis]
MQRSLPTALFVILICAVATLAGAAELTGTVTNKTTNKPAARADVILLKLAQGMEEGGRTKTDAQGRYRITLEDEGAPHLVRVVYQDVTYHKQAPPGSKVADVDVYESAAKVAGVRTSMNIMRVEPQNGQVNVMELYAVKNESKPPRSQMSDRTFEFTIPPDAKIDTALVASAGGMPVTGSPIPGKKPGEYGFMFPLRPGETRFQVAYHVPYSGSMELKPHLNGTLEHLVVMVPPGVTLTPADPSIFEAMPDDTGATVRVATNVDATRNTAFKFSGTGTFPPESEQAAPGASGATSAAGGQSANGRELPGGGIGKPIEAPNPLQPYMWWILAGFVALLAAGAWFFYKQPALPEEAEANDAPMRRTSLAQTRGVAPRAGPASPAAHAAGNGRSALLLDALKEELFSLETDRASGRISAEDYAQHKAALDLTLQRALTRNK